MALDYQTQTAGRMPGSALNFFSRLLGSPALGTTTAVHAAVADNGALQAVTTGITNPDVPRNVTATTGGTGANVTAVSVIVTGTDMDGNTQTETLPAFGAGSTGTVVGNKAFATVVSIAIPANGTGVTTAIGLGAKLGHHRRATRNTIVFAFLNNVREATAPTVAFDGTNIGSNTITLNSALTGTPVIIDFYDAF